jgi:hypothetical protein
LGLFRFVEGDADETRRDEGRVAVAEDRSSGLDFIRT